MKIQNGPFLFILFCFVLHSAFLGLNKNPAQKPPPPEDSIYYEDWHARAEEDYAAATSLVKEDVASYAAICFLSHQAVEKVLKSAYYKQGIIPEKIHDTKRLAEKLVPKYLELGYLDHALDALDKIYVPSRYPQDPPEIEFTKEKARECWDTAGVVMSYFKTEKMLL